MAVVQRDGVWVHQPDSDEFDWLGDTPDEDLNRLQVAINEEYRRRRAVKALATLRSVTVGGRVRLGDIRPKKWVGVEGTVTKIDGDKVTVNYEGSRVVIVPVSCLEILG